MVGGRAYALGVDPTLLAWTAAGVAVLALLLAAVAWRRLRVVDRRLARMIEAGAPTSTAQERIDELSDDLDLLLQATSDAARTQALAEGEPRNVVVRCWVALEDAAASSGLTRDPAETAAEFTQRFLGVWDVDEVLTQELAELYREARFSRHPITRETGDRAVGVVNSIHDQLRARERHRAGPDANADEHGDTGAHAVTDVGDGR